MVTLPAPSLGRAEEALEQLLHPQANVSTPERVLSMLGGGALLVAAMRLRGWQRAAVAGAGSLLVYRGVSGHSTGYRALGISTAGGRLHAASAEVDERRATHVRRTVTINRPRAELYAFWRDFTNLPHFMQHLERVTILSDARSRWVATGPAGTTVTWDAVITNDRDGELIAWESIEPAQVANRGTVRFADAPAGRGTEVSVDIDWEAPARRIGRMVAKLAREEPDIQVREDLRRFKQLMEAGEIPTTEGQPSCR